MTQSPDYSVVIPAYNSASTIAQSIETVLSQTVSASEIIVIDDGSTDETCRVVEEFGDRVSLATQENGGPAVARNHGMRLAQHNWVALLDADDSWLPHKMERQLQECAEDVGLIHCSELEDQVDYGERGLDFERLWTRNDIGTSTVVLNKSAFDTVGGFNEDPRMICVEDYNLWLRILCAGYRIATVSEPLVDYTPAEGHLSGNAERVVKAELFNLEHLTQILDLSPATIRTKQNLIYQEYATTFFWRRNMPLARHYYGMLLKRQMSLTNFSYWAATFLPANLLDAMRSYS